MEEQTSAERRRYEEQRHSCIGQELNLLFQPENCQKN
jgi:hypothetical protein